ncbi:hypothetical protein AB0N05_37435 [Nocardia sp. NPDC051030]|uniref:hypothetical protein n=1 Tax=Nocardia sp. NPDC051030 TaxID=3155162 RepID=UPI00343CF1AE
MSKEPVIELVVFRVPDGGSEVDLFVDGVLCQAVEYHIDPGRGADCASWQERLEANLAEATPAARLRLQQIYDSIEPIYLWERG